MERLRFRGGIVAVAIVLALLLPTVAPVLALDDGSGDGAAGAPPAPDAPGAGSRGTNAIDPVDVADTHETYLGKSVGERLGEQVAGLGDVDNDGFDDFGMLSPSKGLCYVFMGGMVVTEAPVRMLEGTGVPLTEESQVRPAGDLDNDGFDDVLITAPGLYLPSKRAAGAVFVFYGTPAGLANEPDQALYGSEADGRFGMDVDALGDFNRDGYDDIVVGADGVNEDTGRVLIYLGGPAGLQDTPAWLWDGEGRGDRFGYAVTGAGDLNSDGWMDFAVGAPFAVAGDSRGKVYIFYGAPRLEDVWMAPPLVGKMLRSYFGLSIRLAGDVNNDGFSDLIVSSPDAGIAGAGRVELYLGSERGIGANASRVIEGQEDESHLGFTIAYLGDVNRDGCDDVAIGAQLYSTEDKPERGKVYVFFGDRYTGFSTEPKVEEVGSSTLEHLSAGLAGAGDVDGDAFMDVLVGAPGFDAPGRLDVGAVLLFRGADLTMPPLGAGATWVEDRDEGTLLLCEARPYHLAVAVTHRTDATQLKTIDVVLDPSREDVTYTYHKLNDRIDEVSDPKSLARVVAARMLDDPEHRDTYVLWLELILGWGFPVDRPLGVAVSAVDNLGLRVEGTFEGLGQVVSALAFEGELALSGEHQGALAPGDWVRGGETIRVGGVTVVYDLTQAGVVPSRAYHPPMTAVSVVAKDDMGGTWSAPPEPGEPVALDIQAPSAPRTDLVYTVSIESPDHARVFRTLAFGVRVDSTPVRFDSPKPDEGEVTATLRVNASIVITDPMGPGVDASTPYRVPQYRLALATGDGGFGPWLEAFLQVEPDRVVAYAEELLTVGTNHIQWRAFDRVGNGPTDSVPYPMRVDLGNLTFTSPVPSSAVWFSAPIVTVGVTIENTKGNAIDLTHVQYRISTAPGVFSEWTTVNVGDVENPSMVTVSVDDVRLAEGRANYVQWRARDTQRREYITSPLYRVQVDLTGPAFSHAMPAEGTFVVGRNAIAVGVLVSDPQSGVVEGSVRYQVVGEDEAVWHYPTVVREGAGYECSAVVTLPEGVDNYVRWQAMDLTGHASAPFQQRVMVDNTAPSFSDFSPREGEVVRLQRVELSVRIDDLTPVGDHGAGVDLRTIEYAMSRPSTQGYTAWMRLDKYDRLASPVVPFYMVSFAIDVEDGDQNFLVVRVTDGTGGNTATSEPLRIVAELGIRPLPPVIQLSEPRTTSLRYGAVTYFDASDSYDPNGDAIEFLWNSNLDGLLSTDPSFSAILSKGHHTITLTVRETSGALSAQRSFDLVVEPPAEPHRPLSALWEQVVVLVIVACIVVVVAMQAWRIRV